MKTTFRSILLVVATVVIGAALFLGGVAFGRMGWGTLDFGPGAMMGNFRPNTFNQPGGAQDPYGYGMMGNGMMSGGMMNNGMMGGGMMGRQDYGSQPGSPQVQEITAEMPVSSEQALETAQRYLDTYLPGVNVEEKAEPFYGYYTIDIQRDGKIVGMLSVNGFTRQVILHSWHGDFIEMSGDE